MYFYVGGQRILPGDERCEVSNLGGGKHTLRINKTEMGDLGTLEARTPSNRGDDVSCSCSFNVEKGEEDPRRCRLQLALVVFREHDTTVLTSSRSWCVGGS